MSKKGRFDASLRLGQSHEHISGMLTHAQYLTYKPGEETSASFNLKWSGAHDL